MVTDQIADMLTRIRNGQRVGHPTVLVPASKSKRRVLDVLVNEGYLHSFEDVEDLRGKPAIKVHLRYDDRGEPVIKEIKRLSSPGLRRYVGGKDIPSCKGGLGTIVVSTPKGVVCDREARKLGVGGELVCSVF